MFGIAIAFVSTLCLAGPLQDEPPPPETPTKDIAAEKQKKIEEYKRKLEEWRKKYPEKFVPKRNSRGYYSEVGKAYTTIVGPVPPITSHDLVLWKQIVPLSVEQDAFLQKRFEEYREKEEAAHNEHVQPLWDKASKLNVDRDPQTHSDGELWAAFYRDDVRPALEPIRAIEREFFNSVRNMIAESQQDGWDRATNVRRRQWFNPRGYASPPGGNVDLIEMFYSLPLKATEACPWPKLRNDMAIRETLEMSPTDPAAFDALINAYDREATAAFKHIGRLMLESAERDKSDQHRMYLAIQREDMDEHAALAARYRAREKRLDDEQMRVQRLNNETLRALEDVLPPLTWRALRDAYRTRVFRTLFPDKAELDHPGGSFFEQVFEEVELTAEQRETLSSIRGEHDARYAHMNRRMIDAYVEYAMMMHPGRPIHWDQVVEKQREVEAMHAERLDLSRRTVASVAAMFDEENAPEALSLLVEKQRSTFAAAEKEFRLMPRMAQ